VEGTVSMHQLKLGDIDHGYGNVKGGEVDDHNGTVYLTTSGFSSSTLRCFSYA
jgi:hypothetical protein